MKNSKSSDAQIIETLKRVECGISEPRVPRTGYPLGHVLQVARQDGGLDV